MSLRDGQKLEIIKIFIQKYLENYKECIKFGKTKIMSQLGIGDIKVGYRFKALDTDDYKWYLVEITSVNSTEFEVKDIDSHSIWQGMYWTISNEEITDTSLYKSL